MILLHIHASKPRGKALNLKKSKKKVTKINPNT